jgi:anion transporter
MTTTPTPTPRWTFAPRTWLAVGLAGVSVLGVALIPGDLSPAGRVALGVFVLTVIGWTLTKLNDTYVALFAALGLVLTSTLQSESFFASLGNSVVWLMFGAFIVARGLNQSGLSARLTQLAARRARTVSELFYLLTAVLLVTALLIPSTSARAALMLPLYQALAAAFRDRQLNRALALMLPVNILLTGVASLVGAGAHLVINDALGALTGRPFTFVEWLLMGLPFAAISAFGATWLIVHLFLDARRRGLQLGEGALAGLPQPGPLTVAEKYMLSVTFAVVALWATEPLHHLDHAVVAVLGALAVALPKPGILKFKEAAKGVEWEMILFVSASLALSTALVESGAGAWLVQALLVRSGLSELGSQLLALAGVALVTLTSHLYITSRSARGAVIAPLTVLLAYSLGLDPRVLAFVTAAGIGYCITLVVSAKPLTMFQQIDGGDRPTFAPGDLLKLSGLLTPAHAVLVVAFGLFYWPLFGGEASAAPVNAAQPLTRAEAQLADSPLATGQSGLLGGAAFVPEIVLRGAGLSRREGAWQIVSQPAPASAESPETPPSAAEIPEATEPAEAADTAEDPETPQAIETPEPAETPEPSTDSTDGQNQENATSDPAETDYDTSDSGEETNDP